MHPTSKLLWSTTLTALAMLLLAGCGGSGGSSDCTEDSCFGDLVCNLSTGQCQPADSDFCEDVTCDTDQSCDPTNGECIDGDTPDRCLEVTCTEGQTCNPDNGQCEGGDSPDLCLEVTCQEGQTCNPDNGQCEGGDPPDPCFEVTCPDGQTCNPDNGQCEGGSPNLCAEVMCGNNETCNPDNGQCEGGDPPNLCADVLCGDNETCNPDNGQCEGGDPPDVCLEVTCPEGEACNPDNGQCEAIDLCADANCQDNQRCNPDNGQCEALEANATMTAEVRLSRNANLQLDPLYRANLTSGSKMGRGVLYLQLCEDFACEDIVVTRQANEQYLYSTGFTQDIVVEDLPAGRWFARFVLDTQYSQEHGADFATWGGVSPLDIIQSEGADPQPAEHFNPPAGTVELTLDPNTPADMGLAVMGTFVNSEPAFPVATETGFLLATTEDEEGVFRNRISIVDTETYEVTDSQGATLHGEPFTGDLCGMIEGDDKLYTIGVGAQGAYVFSFDKATRRFDDVDPAWIPHPECGEGGTCPNTLSAPLYPFPCKGVLAQVGRRTMLYLTEFKGAGALQNTQAYQMTAVDVTGMASGNTSVTTYATGDARFITGDRIFRGVAFHNNTLYLVEPSWSRAIIEEARQNDITPENTIHAVPVGPDGALTFDNTTSFSSRGTAEDNCSSNSRFVPGFTIADAGGMTRLFIGNDEDITSFRPDGSFLGAVDTQNYGKLITSFAASPDGTRLYGMPNCKSARDRASVQLSQGPERTNLDRHATVVMDLTDNGAFPALLDTERDFDRDGDPDGGIDMEFLYYKRDLLRWCEDCTGSVPPTVYTGPSIIASNNNLFMIGTGIIGVSGLGQVGDIGVYDLDSGNGVLFREHHLWIDGPSSRWGFDINPANLSIEPLEDDISVGAIHFLSGR